MDDKEFNQLLDMTDSKKSYLDLNKTLTGKKDNNTETFFRFS